MPIDTEKIENGKKPDYTFPLIVNIFVFIFIMYEIVVVDVMWLIFIVPLPIWAVVHAIKKGALRDTQR